MTMHASSRRWLPWIAASLVLACGAPPESHGPASAGTTGRDGAPRVAPGDGPIPVVVISIDTLRSDRLPIYGYTGVETPAIDRLRADATLYERAYAHAPLTLPSHVSLMTGQLPGTTGVRDNARYSLASDYEPYLPTLLQHNGFATGAAVSSFVLRSSSGFDQGFDFFDDATNTDDGGLELEAERAGPATLAATLPWLQNTSRALDRGEISGLFLFVHLYEPHLPYQAPAPFVERYGNTYESEIAAADAVVSDLLDQLQALDIYDGALIVLLSDHGEGLGEHGEKSHGVMLYRESIQVPLLIKLPAGARAGTSVAAPVQLIDVMPTILDVLSLPHPSGLEGQSLVGDELEPERILYAETLYPWLHYGWSDLASIVSGRFHYIHGPEPELFDLVEDPAELRNILGENRRPFRTLEAVVLERRQPLVAPVEDEDSEARRQLASLGYLSNTSPVPSDGPLADPRRELVAASAMLDEAFGHLRTQEHARAAESFRAVLDRYPSMVDAWAALGSSLLQLERHEEAFEALAETLRLTDGSPQAALLAARALISLGRMDDAREHARIAIAGKPTEAQELIAEIALDEGDLDAARQALELAGQQGSASPALRRRLGLALSSRGQHAEALSLLDALARERPEPPALVALATALAGAGQLDQAAAVVGQLETIAPGNAGGLEIRGLLALRAGRLAEAQGQLEQAVAAMPTLPNAWNLLAVARFQLRDVPGAIEAWQRAVALDPNHFDALYNLAFTATQAGLTDVGRDALLRYIATAPPARFARELNDARALLARMGG